MEVLFVFIGNVVRDIINPLIGLLFALALAFFVYGAAQFILNSDDASKRDEGKKNLLYGFIGLFIMSAVFGILTVVTATFGVGLPR